MNKQKKVNIDSSLRGGGAQRVCVNIANGLVDLGWKVDMVVLNLNNTDYLDDVSNKINLSKFKFKKNKIFKFFAC